MRGLSAVLLIAFVVSVRCESCDQCTEMYKLPAPAATSAATTSAAAAVTTATTTTSAATTTTSAAAAATTTTSAAAAATTSSASTTNVTGARDAPDADKCNTLKNYLGCLETASGAGCPLDSAKATALSAITDCSLSSPCKCQKTYWESGDDSAKCKSAKTYLSCLEDISNKGEKSCNGTVTAANLKPDVESKIQTMSCSSAGFRAEASFTLFALLLTVCAFFSN